MPTKNFTRNCTRQNHYRPACCWSGDTEIFGDDYMCDLPIKSVERFLAVGTPIVVVNSHDHPHTMSRLVAMLEAKQRPVINWDIANGYVGANDGGRSLVTNKLSKEDLDAAKKGPHLALQIALKLPPTAVLVMDNLHRFWGNPAVDQCLLNIREPFKASKRCVIGLTLNAALPVDLVQSVSYIEDPLPSEALLTEKVQQVYHLASDGKDLEAGTAALLARELRGTSPFRAEQLASQSLTRDGIDRDRLRENARKQINDTPGLSVESGSETFDDIGGLDAIREYLKRYFSGP